MQDLNLDETNEISSEVRNGEKELTGNLFSPDYEPSEEELDAVMEAAAKVAAERNRVAEKKLFEEIEMEIKKKE